MSDSQTKARAKAIEEVLIRIRTKLDQLVPQAEKEGFDITQETTDALVDTLGDLLTLEEEATALQNTRLVGSIRIERDRNREALGLTPKRRRR